MIFCRAAPSFSIAAVSWVASWSIVVMVRSVEGV